MTTNADNIRELSAALADELEPTAREMAKLCARYGALKEARYLIPSTGEVLSAKDYESECADLNRMIKAYIERHGPLSVEPYGEFRLQQRAGAPTYDAKAIAEHDRPHFEEALEMGVVTIDHAKAKPHLDERLSWLRPWQIPGRGTTALIIEREK